MGNPRLCRAGVVKYFCMLVATRSRLSEYQDLEYDIL